MAVHFTVNVNKLPIWTQKLNSRLVCIADGVPQPTLSWEKDGSPLSEGAGEYTILPSGELVIDITQVKKEIDRLRKYHSSCYITTGNYSDLIPICLFSRASHH
uniref:Ig-like domain-containing protein n=1 Tax=Amphiprion percula TaxID=161767 RepID=A0A3P8RRY8_AMPPE